MRPIQYIRAALHIWLWAQLTHVKNHHLDSRSFFFVFYSSALINNSNSPFSILFLKQYFYNEAFYDEASQCSESEIITQKAKAPPSPPPAATTPITSPISASPLAAQQTAYPAGSAAAVNSESKEPSERDDEEEWEVDESVVLDVLKLYRCRNRKYKYLWLFPNPCAHGRPTPLRQRWQGKVK